LRKFINAKNAAITKKIAYGIRIVDKVKEIIASIVIWLYCYIVLPHPSSPSKRGRIEEGGSNITI